MTLPEKKSLALLYSSSVIKDEFAVQSLQSVVSVLGLKNSVELADTVSPVRSISKNFLVKSILEIRSIIRVVRNAAASDVSSVLLYRPSFSLLLIGLFILRKKEVVVDISGVPFITATKKAGWRKKISRPFIKKLLRIPKRIIVSNTQEKFNVCTTNKVPAERVKVISKGIPAVLFQQLTAVKYKQPKNSITLTYAGPLNNYSVVWPLLMAVERSSHIKLNFIGDGKLYATIRKYIRRKRIRSVSLYNTLTWKRKLPFYQTSSALVVMPFETDESIVTDELLEAASTGLPILYLGKNSDQPFLRRLDFVTTVDNITVESISLAVQRIASEAITRSAANSALVYERFLIERLQATYAKVLTLEPEVDELLSSELSLSALLDSTLPA